MNGCNHYRTNNSCMRNANNRQPMNNRPRMEMQTDKNMECKNRRVAALKEYAKYYGPLTIDTADDEASESFLWVETPWPWEGGGC